MTAESEFSLGPLKMKGKDAFSYLGWLVAVSVMGYAAWGPPNAIQSELVKQGVTIEAIKNDVALVKSDVASLKIKRRDILLGSK